MSKVEQAFQDATSLAELHRMLTVQPPSQPVVILGQHRSGTSLLAHILHTLGVHMGTFFRKPDAGNPGGYWEDLIWRNINKTILNAAGGTWYKPPPYQDINGVVAHPDIWHTIDSLVRTRDAHHPIWGFKDPRTILTIHALQHCLPQHTKYITIKRDQEQVIQSLQNRASLRGYTEPYQHWLDLTSYYDMQLEDFLLQLYESNNLYKSTRQITYEQLLEDPLDTVVHLASFLQTGTHDKIREAASLVRRPE